MLFVSVIEDFQGLAAACDLCSALLFAAFELGPYTLTLKNHLTNTPAAAAAAAAAADGAAAAAAAAAGGLQAARRQRLALLLLLLLLLLMG